MTVPTITSGTPPDKVARLIKNFDELIVEGDDNFQRTVLENFYGATLRVPRSRAYLWFGSAIICSVIAAALLWIFALPSSSQLPHFNEVGKTIEKGAHDVGKTVEKSAENISSGLDRDLVATVVWPVVAIIVAVLVYLVIRKAIEGGNTVEISWKVTEKAYGRIVVRKVVRCQRT